MRVNCLAFFSFNDASKACQVFISERDSISVSRDQSKSKSELMIPF